MKKMLTLIVVLLISTITFAQDTLEVPYLDESGSLIINALSQFVAADTNSNGEQLHQVYKLQRGGTYMYNESPVFTNPIHLVADNPGATNELRPPLLIVTANAEGEVPYEHCLTTYADLTVKNIAMTTTSADGSYSWANAIVLGTDGLKLVLDGCSFTLLGWGMVEAYINDGKIFVSNCTVRNATVYDYGDEWCPFFIEAGGGTFDTLSFTNNTFFNLQGTVINMDGSDVVRNLIFDHNTLVNVVKGFSALNAHYNTIVTNNIFYNVQPHSVTLEQVLDGEDQSLPAVISADTLLGNEPGTPDSVVALMSEHDRKFLLKNNCYAWSQNVQNYWAAFDSVVTPVWMTSVASSMFADDAGYPGFVEEGNVNMDPGFVSGDCTDDLVAQMTAHRESGTFGFWGYDPGNDFTMPGYFLTYPYPEDFSYTANLTATDGFHVGSLQWYPGELAQYQGPNASVAIDEDENYTAADFTLEQNYPNPFNPVTTIHYMINHTEPVKLTVYNVLGQKIRTLVDNASLSAGRYSVQWHGINDAGQIVANGIYFYQLQAGSQVSMKKMMFLK
ncbi:MAG: T9SS type A sorting domain-containing protein [Candidatus Marinimicrobia bacterium]|nr:T9SS type A sorting domain-containing protein [Candidatus Neomarinimicrobiota bacterium]